MDGSAIARLFGLSAFTITKNTEGMSHKDCLVKPSPGGNCLNWVLGHIVATRNMMVRVMGRDPFWDEEKMKLYARGAPPLADTDKAVALEELLSVFAETQKEVVSYLNGKSAEDLGAPLPEPDELLGKTLGDAFSAFCWHEGYHAGQIGILRRLAGKDGVLT